VSSGELRSCRCGRPHGTRQRAERHDRMPCGKLSMRSGLTGIRPAARVQASQNQRQQRTHELHVTVFKRFRTSVHGHEPPAVHPVPQQRQSTKAPDPHLSEQTVDLQCQDDDRTTRTMVRSRATILPCPDGGSTIARVSLIDGCASIVGGFHFPLPPRSALNSEWGRCGDRVRGE